MKKILVVCSQNRWRSPTAEAIYRHDNRIAIRSAGLAKNSPHFITRSDIEWADILLYMEKEHLEKTKKIFPSMTLPRAINLDIPDIYPYMDPELIETLREKIEAIFNPYSMSS